MKNFQRRDNLIILLLLSFSTIMILATLSIGAAIADVPSNVSNSENITIANNSSLPAGNLWAPNGTISGYIVDMNGNKVPQAFVTLYKNGMMADKTPIYSSDGTNDTMGAYQFTGLTPGNYTVKAEKSDPYFYNGTAAITIYGDGDMSLDVTLKSYLFKPWITPTPVPTVVEPTAEPMQEATAVPTIVPTNSPVLPTYIFALVPIAIGGMGAVIYITRQSNNRKGPDKKSEKIDERINIKKKESSSTNVQLQLLNNNAVYRAELEELVSKSTNGYSDIAVINGVNAMAKKYGVDQNVIFSDIRRLKGRKD